MAMTPEEAFSLGVELMMLPSTIMISGINEAGEYWRSSFIKFFDETTGFFEDQNGSGQVIGPEKDEQKHN